MLKLWPLTLTNIGLEWSLKSFLAAPLDGRWLVGWAAFRLKKVANRYCPPSYSTQSSTDAMPHQRASLLGRWVISCGAAEGQTD